MIRTAPVRRLAALGLAVALSACAAPADHPVPAAATDAAFARLVALQGDWVAAEPGMGEPGAVASSWRVTGAGTAVVETIFPGMPEEMVTVFYRDGGQLVLTHYCALGNQPHLRAVNAEANAIEFDFVSGENLDPARDMHMHHVRFDFVSADELRESWLGWTDGKPATDHQGNFHLVRKKA